MLYFPGTIYLYYKNKCSKRKEENKTVEYVITDGHGCYIRQDFSGKYVPVRNKSLADTWEQRVKAQNILNNALRKKERRRFHIAEIDDGNQTSECKQETTVSEINALSNEKPFNIDKVKELTEESTDDSQIDKWISGISSMKDFVLDAESRKEILNEEISKIDKEVTDIQHYIELNNLNAYQGFLAYKMLQGRLRKRRAIKNEWQVLSQLGGCKIDSSMLIDVQNAINEMNNRTYTPRILSELFK